MPDTPLGRRAATDAPPPRRRPLIPVLAGAVIGIAVDGTVGPPVWFWSAVGIAALLGAVWALSGSRARWAYSAFALLLVVPVGGIYQASRFRLNPPHHLQNRAIRQGGLYRVRGRVRHEARYHHRRNPFHPKSPLPGFWSFRVELRELSGRGGWQKASGGLTVLVDAAPPKVRVGDVVEFPCLLYADSPPTNPGQRDRALQNRRRGSHARAVVRDGRAVARLRCAPWYSPGAIIGGLRAGLRERLERHLPAAGVASKGVLISLLFGDRSSLTPEEQDLLAESGTLHFLAISGLHVGIFCLFVSELLRSSSLAVQWRHVLTIALVWAYVLFTGFHTPAVRAGGVITLMLAAPLLQRPRDSLSALMAAALATLAFAPQQLFSAGFQLTFVAVWGILCVYPRLEEVTWPWQGFVERVRSPEEATLWDDLRCLARSHLLLSCTVWVVTAPLLAWHFHRLSFLVPLLNLVLWPLVAVVLVLGFVILTALLVGGWGATLLLSGALFVAGDVKVFLRAASRLPGYGVYLPAPPVWWVALFFAAVGVWVMRRRLWRGRPVFIAAVLALGLTYIWQDAAVRLGREFKMVVADVGHGQAVVVELPRGQTVLFDAGARSPHAAERVASILWKDHVDHVNAAVLSHFNTDHCVFFPYLTRRFRIARAVLPKVPQSAPLADAVRDLLHRRGVRVHNVAEGGAFEGGGLTCEVFHPGRRFAFSEGVSQNDMSMVVRGRYGGLSFLLPGDVEERAIERLLRDYGDRLRSDVLVLPHHGQYHAGLGRFLDWVRPLAAVASNDGACCGAQTAKALRYRGIPLWETGRDGAVIVTLPPGGVRIEGYASGRSKIFELESSERGPEWACALPAE